MNPQAQAAPSTVYLYVFNGFADWEAAWATASINTSDFQREPGRWRVQTVALRLGLVTSMGGLSVLPDHRLGSLFAAGSAMLILPGGAGWDAGEHLEAARKGDELLKAGVPLAPICGATAGLARVGTLQGRRHTSNALAYLKCSGYADSDHYEDAPVVVDGALITAGGMHGLEFAREILRVLGVYDEAALEARYALYKHGDSASFDRMRRAAAGGAAAN